MGKKPFGGPTPPGMKIINESTTDPESGIFHKGEHKVVFAYSAHTVCDRNNFILDTVITPGNIHDSVAFDGLYQKVTNHYPRIRVVTADAGYKIPWICKQIIDNGRIPSLPYKQPMTKKGFFKRYDCVYDPYYRFVICPNNKTLYDAAIDRNGYQVYKSIPFNCKHCDL